MVLYEKELTLDQEAIDLENCTYDEAFGYVIYLHHEKIDGLMDKLYYVGLSNDRKRVVKSIYIYADENFEKYRLCINYKNNEYSLVSRRWFSVSSEDMSVIMRLCEKRVS